MTTLTFDGNTIPPEIIETINATWGVENGNLRISNVASGGNAEAVISASDSGVFSGTFHTDSVSEFGHIGFNFKRAASDDWVAVLYTFSNEQIRILERRDGGTPTVLASANVSTSVSGQFDLEVTISPSGLFTVVFDGVEVATANTTYNSSVVDFSIRLDTQKFFISEVTYPAASGVLTKTVTFEIPTEIQGKSNMAYWVLPASGGASLSSGTLDTSSTTVSLDLSSIDSVTDGQGLLLWATDKATATTPYSAWDDSNAVVTGG